MQKTMFVVVVLPIVPINYFVIDSNSWHPMFVVVDAVVVVRFAIAVGVVRETTVVAVVVAMDSRMPWLPTIVVAVAAAVVDARNS